MKSVERLKYGGKAGRAPQGARGLKYDGFADSGRAIESCPARGTWIEISMQRTSCRNTKTSCPARGTWIEISQPKGIENANTSCPARGTWIEILAIGQQAVTIGRAPQGARGLKLSKICKFYLARKGRAPQGARGLKFKRWIRDYMACSRAPQGARGLK